MRCFISFSHSAKLPYILKVIANLIKEYFGNLDVPVIYNFPTGHEFPFINVPIGLKVRLDANKKQIEILEEMYNE